MGKEWVCTETGTKLAHRQTATMCKHSYIYCFEVVAKYSFSVALQTSVDFAIGILQAISTSGFESSAIVSESQNSEHVCIRYASKARSWPHQSFSRVWCVHISEDLWARVYPFGECRSGFVPNLYLRFSSLTFMLPSPRRSIACARNAAYD